MFSFTKTDTCLSLYINGTMYMIQVSDARFPHVWNALKKGDPTMILDAINYEPLHIVGVKKSEGKITVDTNGVVSYNSLVMDNSLTRRIADFVREGAPIASLVAFLDKLLENPALKSATSPEVVALTKVSAESLINTFIDAFYGFISHRNLPITLDGNFLAYKAVDSYFWSKKGGTLKLIKGTVDEKTGKILNKVGEEIECERDSVDPDRTKECSYGLHVGCIEYSGPGGTYNSTTDNVVIVEVNPKDVIAVPPDYDRTKMRVCKYKVIQVYKEPLDKPCYKVDKTDVVPVSNPVDAVVRKFDELEPTVDIDSLWPGDMITFTYEGKVRHAEVSSVTGELLSTILLKPEVNSGEFRNFRIDKITECKFKNDGK